MALEGWQSSVAPSSDSASISDETCGTEKQNPKFVMFKGVMPCNANPNRSAQDWGLSWPVDLDLAGIAKGWQWHGQWIKRWHVEARYQI